MLLDGADVDSWQVVQLLGCSVVALALVPTVVVAGRLSFNF